MREPDSNLMEKARHYAERHGYSSIRLFCAIRPPRLVVSLDGTLDTESSTDFYEFLRAAQSVAATEGGLSVDLGAIRYVSSTGIGILSTAMMEYTKERVPFTLRCVPEKTRELFQLLGIWSYFSIDPDGKASDV